MASEPWPSRAEHFRQSRGLQSFAMRRDYSHAAQQQHSSSSSSSSSSRASQTIPRRSPSHKASVAAGFTFQIKNRHPVSRTQCRNPCQRLLAFSRCRRARMSQHYPRRIGSHARIQTISIHLQLQQTGDETGDPPGRYHPARCGNPDATLAHC